MRTQQHSSGRMMRAGPGKLLLASRGVFSEPPPSYDLLSLTVHIGSALPVNTERGQLGLPRMSLASL